MNFLTFNNRFPTELACIEHFIKLRYAKGVVCPHCGATEHKIYHKSKTPKNFNCCNCNNDFSIFTNTIFYKSDTDLRKWYFAINAMINSKKGISALQLKREIDVTYKTAWRMLKLIRSAMGNADMSKAFEAIVEIDETYVGGKPHKENRNDDDNNPPKPPLKRGRGTSKTPVVGIKERNSKRVHATVALPNSDGQTLTGKQLFKILDTVCKDDTIVMTDDFSSYNILDRNPDKFLRLTVNHSIGQFATRNGIHTNGIESFWALLKRGIYGIYHHISTKYLQNYVNEFCFRANNKNNAFNALLTNCVFI
ncbi:MAG: IS1595 family transposase [Endomicrobium sp.]|jgi:transposase-like protein|nr:IS1595 family transposase [Endomicrobium sp.]